MSWTRTRAQIARAKQLDPNADVHALTRDLRADRLEAHIRSVLVRDPVGLDERQRNRLAVLILTEGRALTPEAVPGGSP